MTGAESPCGREPVRAEFVIEPFVEGTPGPYVTAALSAWRDHGFEPDVGAFASTINGDFDGVVRTVDALVRAAYDQGATAVQVPTTSTPCGEKPTHEKRRKRLVTAREPEPLEQPEPVDLLIHDAELVATVDARRREIPGGWVGITNGYVSAVGGSGDGRPRAGRCIDARGCLVTPGLVNTHHHLYQNLTRAYAPMTSEPLFGWLQSLYSLWTDNLDEEAEHVAAWVGLAELALSGCTTSSDHHYLHPERAGDLLGAEIAAAADLQMRFHPTYGSMSLGVSAGGLPPDDAVLDEDEILAESRRSVEAHHDPRFGSMIQVALAPCSPFSVSADLMRRSAELAEELDVGLHTHMAENVEDDTYSMERFGMRPVDYYESVGWLTDRTWGAHVVMPNLDEIARLGAAGVGVAHCPSSNMILSSGIAPVVDLVAAGCPVGLGCDGSSSADSASLWQEARLAMLAGKLRSGPDRMTARMVLEMATRGGAGCLGRVGELGELSVGAAGDVTVWRMEGPVFAGVLDDPIEGWLRCGPTAAWHTIVAGRALVDRGEIVSPRLHEMLRSHRRIARRFQPSRLF